MQESGFFDSGESLTIWHNFQLGYESGICTKYLNSGKFMIDERKEEKREKNSIFMQKFLKIS